MKLELVSFKICPYVQRSVITLRYKKAPFDITYIDLENPPEWFDRISPLGKVPLLKVDDRTVLFESAVINEFIDETVGTPLMPRDPLQKAFERAWIEYGSELFMSFYALSTETDRARFQEARSELFADLRKLEELASPKGPHFGGERFSLVDAAYAPFFMRAFLSPALNADPAWKEIPKTRSWGDALLKLAAVRESVVPEFEKLVRDYARKNGSLLFDA